jgi:hypothetical protein
LVYYDPQKLARTIYLDKQNTNFEKAEIINLATLI